MPTNSKKHWLSYWEPALHTLFRKAIDLWVSRFGLLVVPRIIWDKEVVVRAIMSPYHLNRHGSKLRRTAFMPPPSRDEVSVSRLRFVGPTLCKIYARVRVESRVGDKKGQKRFVGLAFLTSHRVRVLGADVVDSRAQYLGHGDILHGFEPAPRGEALPAAVRKVLDERCDELVKRARFRIDSGESQIFWSSKKSRRVALGVRPQ